MKRSGKGESSGSKKLTSKTHLEEKERLEKIFKNQSEDSEDKITYKPVTKKLVEGVQFEHLVLNGETTVYLKCLHPRCKNKKFTAQEHDSNTFVKCFFKIFSHFLKIFSHFFKIFSHFFKIIIPFFQNYCPIFSKISHFFKIIIPFYYAL